MLKRTPLFENHKKLGARLVEFGGWEMPVQYKGVIDEHTTVRKAVGLFDVSHMGELFVTGDNAGRFINHIITNNIERIGDGQCQYTAACYDHGGVVDDLIVYQFNPQKYLIVANASNIDKDFEWLQKNQKFDVTLENKSDQFSLLALQGPKAEQVLKSLVDLDLTQLKSFSFKETIIKGCATIVSRTGYTGEDGFEIFVGADKAPEIWDLLLNKGGDYGIQPIGLAARDTLRLEASYSLYGHEITENINPLEARLGWVVKLDKTEFIGKKALQEAKDQGLKRQLVGLEMIEPGIPRDGYEIFNQEEKIGVITSGTFSPTLKKGIGLALIQKEFAKEGSQLLVQIRHKKQKARVVKLPFYKRP